MAKFAKLFDVADTQVLVQVLENEDELPSFRIKTEINGVNLEMAHVYKPGEEGWGNANKSLELFTQEKADKFYAEMCESAFMLVSEDGEHEQKH